MQNKDNRSKSIYDKTTRTWFEVSEKKYREYDRWRTALRKRMQYHGECSCSRKKWWLCDGMCDDCEFHAAGDVLSLDATRTNEDGDEVSLLDGFASPESDLNDIVLDQILMQQLLL